MIKRLLRLAALLGIGAGLGLALPAQVVASFNVGAPSHANPHFETFSAGARVGIALPPVPHLLVMWNLADIGMDRLARQPGVSLATGLEVWLSPARRPAQSHLPLLLAEVGIGRRWGKGLHGFTTWGAGAGWSLGDWVPYAEYRRRVSFHPGRPRDNEVLLGVKYILFG